MNRYLLAVILVWFSFQSIAQIKFEKGYIIDNNDKKTECMIRNADWKKSPQHITCILKGVKVNIGPENIKLFEIYDKCKYVSADIEIDTSYLYKLRNLTWSSNREPEWKIITAFVKVIVDGEVSLYRYHDNATLYFYYNKQGDTIKPLVYKKYITKAEGKRVYDNTFYDEHYIVENNTYKSQLNELLSCTKVNDADQLEYKEESLKAIFIKHLRCKQVKFADYKSSANINKVNLRGQIGINSSNTSILHSGYAVFAFPRNYSLRLGLESEFILPYNNNKFSLLVEPSYNYSNAKTVNADLDSATLRYKALDFATGIRMYFFLNEATKLFINGHHSFGIGLKPTVIYSYPRTDIIGAGSTWSIGAGGTYNRHAFEIRWYTNKNVTRNFVYATSKQSRISFIYSYNLLSNKNK